MSYLVLARKWRPQNFEEVVGQDSITKTLKNSIEKGRIPHALLFAGMRGVGKTTAARIYAKALNCDKGPTASPCNKCPNCLEITAGSNIDVMEIDGASNTSVNDVRELRENVRYLPSKSRYKIYIIDEVHMLSQSAFNALLKTLEEPPPNVIFMFATTEPDDIPQTIISRCQRFDLKPITPQKLIESIKGICKNEQFSISDYSLGIIAAEARGSMRDALSILDKLIAYGGDGIEDEEILDILGLVKRDILYRAAEAVISRDSKSLLSIVEEIFTGAFDPRVFLGELLEFVRNLAVLRVDIGAKIPNVPKDELEIIARLAKRVTREELELIFDVIKDAYMEIGRSDYQRYIIEMALLRASSLSPLMHIDEIIRGIEGSQHPEAAPKTKDALLKSQTKTESSGKEDAAGGSSACAISGQWHDVIEDVKKKKPYIAVALEEARTALTGKTLKICFTKPSFNYEKVCEPENFEIIKRAVIEKYTGNPEVEILVDDKAKELRLDVQKDPPRESPSKAGQGDARGDSAVTKALNILGGRIEGDSYRKV